MFVNIDTVCNEIARQFSPEKIILFNLKRGVEGDPRSFKLCVIKATGDKRELEREIYLAVDSCIPYDILVYTPEEWTALIAQSGSFAFQINQKGSVVYEQAT